MKVSYRRTTGKQLEYVIDTDRLGGFRVYLGDRLLHAVGGSAGLGTGRGSKKRETDAVVAAQRTIELLLGMPEE